jgi:hypothetical protein
LKIQEPTSTVSHLQVRLNADHSTGIETNGVVRNVAVTADPPAVQTLVGVLMKGTSTLDGVRVFFPTTPNKDTTGIRTENTGVKTINNVSAEAENGILVVNGPPLGPDNSAIVRAAFVRASAGILANQSQVFVDDSLVEGELTGLDAFTASGSAALRARHVTVVGSGAANSSGVVSTDFDLGGPTSATRSSPASPTMSRGAGAARSTSTGRATPRPARRPRPAPTTLRPRRGSSTPRRATSGSRQARR